jgi:hypothetical protein
MCKWEYLVVNDVRSGDLSDELNMRGDEGWEVVVIHSSHNMFTNSLFFKRPKPDVEAPVAADLPCCPAEGGGCPCVDFVEEEEALPPNWACRRQEDSIGSAVALKGANLLSDRDILVDILGYTPEEAEERLNRNKVQALENLKLQVMAQNPGLLRPKDR